MIEGLVVAVVVGWAAAHLVVRMRRAFAGRGGCGASCPATTRLVADVSRAVRK